MPELIDKKRTEAKVFLLAGLFIDRPDHEFELARAVIHRCCEEIDKQPTIESKVRHGRWIDNGEDKYICSACKGYVYRWFGKSDFCPRCSADMREVDKDGD